MIDKNKAFTSLLINNGRLYSLCCRSKYWNVVTNCSKYLGGLPSNFRLPSICIRTFTRSVGLAINCAIAPADNPPITARLQTILVIPNIHQWSHKPHISNLPIRKRTIFVSPNYVLPNILVKAKTTTCVHWKENYNTLEMKVHNIFHLQYLITLEIINASSKCY